MEWKKLAASAALALAIVGCAKIAVTPAGDNLDREGLYYALPRTVLKVAVPLKRVVKTPGEYSDTKAAQNFAAELMLVPEDFITEAFEEITIENSALIVSPSPEPDPDQIYHIKADSPWYRDLNQTLSLTTTGIIQGATTKSTSNAPELTVSALELVASLATKIIGVPSLPSITKSKSFETEAFDGGARKAPDPREAAAQRIVDEIKRNEALRKYYLCECKPECGDGVKAQLAKIEARQKFLLPQLFGTMEAKQYELSFEVRPEKGKGTHELFAVVKTDCGSILILPLEPDLLALPIDPEILAPPGVGKNRALCAYSLRVYPVDPAWLEKKGIEPTLEKPRGYYYRFPVEGLASIDLEQCGGVTEVLRKRMLIAQFGVLTALPGGAKSVQMVYQMNYNPETGAITKADITNTGLSAAQAKNVQDAALKALDAATAEKPDPALEKMDDTITLLEKQKTILELQKAIENLKNPPASE